MRLNKTLLVLAFILSGIGFAVSLFLTVEHFRGTVPPCAIGGCEIVTTSNYSVILGVPVALVGSVGYLLMLALLVWYVDSKRDMILSLIAAITALGALFTLTLIVLQLFVIHAVCIYCMTTDLAMLGLFLIFGYDWNKHRHLKPPGPPVEKNQAAS